MPAGSSWPGPAVLGFVLAVCVIEQLRPAQRRRLFARGHLLDAGYAVFYALLVVPLIVLLDAGYAVFYALLVVPLIVLLGAGFSGLLARLEPWLVLKAGRHVRA